MLLLVGVAPIFVIPTDWVSVAQAKMLLLAVLLITALVSFAVARFYEGVLFLPKNLLFFAGALLPIAYFVSALVSGATSVSYVDGLVSQDTVTAVVLLYAVLILGAQILRDTSLVSSALRALALGGLVLVLFHSVRLFLSDALSLGGVLPGDASSVFGSWHDLGVFLGLLLFLAVAQLETERSFPWKILYGVLAAGSLFLLVVVNSVDIWVVLAALCFLVALVQWFVPQASQALVTRTWKRSAVWGILAIGSTVLALWGAALYTYLPQTLQVPQLEVRPSWEGTFAIGERVFSGGSTLIFGAGPNTFTREWSLFKPQGVNATDFWNADFNAGVGTIPTSFVTVGILGIAAWLALAAALLLSTLAFVRRRNSSYGVHDYRFVVYASALYLTTFHVVHVPGLALSALTFLFLGLIVSGDSRESGDRVTIGLRSDSSAGVLRIVAFVVVVSVLIIASAQILRAVLSDIAVNKTVSAYSSSGDLERARKGILTALTLFPNNDRAHRAAIEIGLVELQALAATGETGTEAESRLKETLERTIQHGLSAIAINGGNYQNWLAIAGLYENLAGAGIEGAYDTALSAYEKAIAENPTSPLPLVRLAQLYAAQGKGDVALEKLNAALLLKPDFALALFLRSQLHAVTGRLSEAREDAGQAVRAVPRDPLGWYNLGVVLYSEKSYDDAVKAFQQAIALQNNYANALFVLGLSYDKLGRTDEALSAFKEVQALNPEDDTVSGIIQNIERGLPALPEEAEGR